MKIKNFLAIMMAAVTLSMSAVSCDDDDDDDNETLAEEAADSYLGDMTLTVMGSASEYDSVTFVLKAETDNTISLTTPAIGEGSMALPALTVNGLELTKTSVAGVDIITVSVDEIAGSIEVNGETKNYTFSGLNIAVSPAAETASIAYSLQYGKMPMAMVVAFTGSEVED